MRTAREYLRVSQDRSGRMRSPAEQHAENAHTAERRGVRLLEPYQEIKAVGASRYSRGRRDDFAQLLDDLTTGAFGADELYLWEPSRGSRKVAEWVRLIDACESASVQIWVTTHARLYDPTNHRDRRTLLEDAVNSEFSASEISERVGRAVRARASAGRPHGRQVYGYRRVYNPQTRALEQIIPDEVAAPIVREIFARYADGESLGAIANDLTRRGVATPGRSAVWKPLSVRYMLGNEAYLGHRVSAAGHAKVENAWPALITDAAIWQRCRRRLDAPVREPRRDLTVKHLLSGLVLCGVDGCGAKMYYNAANSASPTYLCAARYHNSRAAGHWSPDPDQCAGLEGQVVEYVLLVWDDDARLSRREDDPRVAELDAELERMRDRLEDYRRAGAALDGPSPAAVAAVERELVPAIEAAEAEQAALFAKGVLPDLGGRSLRQAWPGLSLAQQRTIIDTTVAVTVAPTSQGKRYDPALVRIVPRWAVTDPV